MDDFDLRLWPHFIASGGDPSRPAIIDQVTIDSRRVESSNALFVPLIGQKEDGHKYISNAAQKGAKYILAHKDWSECPLPAHVIILRVDDTLKALQSIAHAYRMQLPGKIIAISGSYGKTMVKDLLEALMVNSTKIAASPESFNSQIGVALSLFTVSHKHDFALIEAGISEKNEMERLADMIAPDHAIITHIGKKHLATLGDLNTIVEEIMQLTFKIPQKNWILMHDSPLIKSYLSHTKATPYFWNKPHSKLPHAEPISDEQGGYMPYQIVFPDGKQYINQTSFGFYYFLDLINITVKAAWLLGISSEAICTALSQYTPEPMRTEIWKSPVGTTFINDTYCSDPQSVDRALRYLDQTTNGGRKFFIFSGLRGIQRHPITDYRHIAEMVRKSKVDQLVLVGNHPYAPLLAELQKHQGKTEISLHSNYQDAISYLQNLVRQEDVVLIKGEKKESLDILTEAFNDSVCTNQCWINLAAIASNIETIRQKLSEGTRIMVMVKALAYGTNDVRMGRFLATCGIDILGVSYVDEGVALKRAGITQSIFVINAAAYEAAKVIKWDLEVGVSEKSLIAILAEEADRQKKKLKVHLHVDTGMSRFGCRPEEALEIAQYIQTFPSLILEGIMTHFACADDPKQDAFTLGQSERFDNVIGQLQASGINLPWKHAANTSGTLRFNFPQYNMVRIGLAAYGLYPSEAAKQTLDLRLALTLISRIVGINTCRAGETISYGRTYTVQRNEQRIAVLPIGYFDGLHRNYSGRASVIIRGKKAPMVGKICMDFMMVDVTDIPNAAIGDSVLIFGEDEYGKYLSPEELASSGDSIIHELITCLGPRIQRIFIFEEAHHLR